jgi:hypothetical protein
MEFLLFIRANVGFQHDQLQENWVVWARLHLSRTPPATEELINPY